MKHFERVGVLKKQNRFIPKIITTREDFHGVGRANNRIVKYKSPEVLSRNEVIFLMREQSYQQFAIVQANSASVLADRLNVKLKELKDKDPVVSFDGLSARICYTEHEEVAEDLGDAFALHGVYLTCSRCPFFEAETKADGTVDERKKVGKCPCAEYGKAYSDGPVCEMMLKMLNEGEIGLCLVK